MIAIHFNRQTNTARHATGGWTYFATGTDPYFDVARAMTDLGEPDGPAVFVDERGVACMTVRSVHGCARRYRPNAGDLAAKRARAEARRLEAEKLAGALLDGVEHRAVPG